MRNDLTTIDSCSQIACRISVLETVTSPAYGNSSVVDIHMHMYINWYVHIHAYAFAPYLLNCIFYVEIRRKKCKCRSVWRWEGCRSIFLNFKRVHSSIRVNITYSGSHFYRLQIRGALPCSACSISSYSLCPIVINTQINDRLNRLMQMFSVACIGFYICSWIPNLRWWS